MKLTQIFAAVFLVVAAPFSAVAQEGDAAGQIVKPVKLLTVGANPFGTQRQFFGQVVARQSVDLAFQVAGQIVEFPVIEGERVAKGALIASLDPETFQLAFDQAALQKDQADRTVARLQQLSGSAVSKVTLDDAITAAGLAEVSLRNAEYGLRHAKLHAPFDALVATRSVANYTTISAGTPVVRLHDMSELRIEIDVPEVLFQQAGENPDVDIVAKFPVGDETYPLVIREFNAEASSVGQTFRLTLGMETPPNLTVLPGSSVTVITRLRDQRADMRVPASALRIGVDGTLSVMVFQAQGGEGRGVVRETPVQADANEEGGFSVRAGLSVGDQIVATGVAALSDGQAVRRFTGFAN